MATDPLDPFAYAERFNPRNRILPAPSETAPVDPLTAEIRRQRDRDMQLNIALSPGPDAVARATRVAREAAVAPGMVEGREDEVQRDLNARRLSDLTGRYPAIGKWADGNPRGAIAAQDDHKALGIVGRAWEGIKEIGRGIPGSLEAGYNQAGKAFNDISLSIDEVILPFANPNAARATLDREQANSRAYAARADAARPKSDSFVVRSALQGIESIPTSMTALAVGLLTRSPNAAAAAMGLTTGAPAYREGLDKGLSRTEALQYGLEQGATEALTERLPAGEWINALTKRTPFGQAILRTLAQEIPGEQGATAVQDLSDWVHLNPHKPFSDYLAARPEAALATAIATVTGTSAQVGSTVIAQRSAEHAIKVADRMAGKAAEARQAKAARDAFDAHGKAAEQSALRKRDPEAYNALIRAQAEEAGVSHVFVPAEAVRAYQQSDSYDGFDDPFSDFEAQIAEAEAAGGDVVLPVEFALGTLPGTAAWNAIKDDMRLAPGGMSAREATSFEDAMADVVAQVSDELARHERETRAALSTQETLIASIQQKLQDAGFTPHAARTQAELLGQRIATRAQRMGREVTGTEYDGTEVRQVMPPALAAARKADATDLVINAMRKGGKAHSGQGPSLVEWIAKRGGIEDRGGDIAGMGGDKWHRGKVGRRKLLKAFDEAQGNMLGSSGANANSIGNLLDAAISEGFFPDLLARREAGEKIDDRVLIDAIGQELAGSPLYAREATVDPMRAAAQELEQLLGQRGVLASDLTDDELRAEVARLAQESGAVGYEQARSEIEHLIELSSASGHNHETAEIAAVSAWLARAAEAHGLDVDGMVHTIDTAAVRHITRQHGDAAKEAKRGQAPITNADILSIPEVIVAADAVIFGAQNKRGQDLIAYVKHMPDGTTLYVEEVRTGKGRLAAASMRKYPGTIDATRLAATLDPHAQSASRDGIDVVDVPRSVKDGASYNDGPRGRILFPAAGLGAGPTIIELFQGRNLSTFLHETGHQWLEELRADAEHPEATDQLKADWQAVQDWFAANGHPLVDGVIPVEAHELWARGTERYLMEGKAPSSALQKLFDTFRGWLINLYRTVEALRSPITPEIREVMDRLIATDEEIARVRETQALAPLFKDAAAAGMTGAEFDAYTGLVAGARGDAQGKLLEKTMAAIKRRVTKQWNDDKRALAAEIGAEVAQRPLFRALDLAKAERLSREWIVDTFGIDALDLLPRRVPPLYVEGGVHPDGIAELAGYGSGREMIEDFIGAERQHRQLREGGDQRTLRARTIEDEVLAEMNRRHGDPFSDGSIEREALAAVNGEMQGEVIAAEARVLGRRSGKRATPYQVARTWARERVRRGNYATEASPAAIQRHARAVAKAGAEAEQAILKGDTEAAFAAKQRQMLSSALLAEAKAANDEVEAARARLDKIARRATMKSVDQDYLDQAHALLEAVDLRERSQKSLERFGKWAEWSAAREAEGFDVVVPPSFEALLGNTNWSRLPIETLLGLDEAVAQVIHLGRLKQTLLDNKERREFDAVVGEAVASAGNLPPKPPKGLIEPGRIERLKAGVAALDAELLKMETIFDWLDGGNPNGVFNRIVFRPIAEAQAREQDMLVDYYGRIKALFEGIDAKTLRRWSEKVTTPFINRETGLPEPLSRQQVIAMALNVGNEGNLQRLADGYGWNAQAIMDFLNSELTASEWQFVQGVWDTIDALWPQIEAVEKRVNGVAPEKVAAREFDTPHGPMRGGYYPAIYDSARDLTAEEQRGREADLFEGRYTRATTRASATKARADKVRRPILLDLGVINRHLGEVIHDITHRESVIQANKFLTDHRVMAAVDQALGPDIRKQMRPWVKFVANSWALERAGNEGVGKFFSKMRANATVVGMGFRLSTMLTQIAGYSNSFEVVGEKWVTEAIARVSASPIKSFEFVMERSGEVRHRMDTLDRDIRSAILATDPLHQLGQVRRFMFHGIGYMDRVVVIPTWLGAYNKALAAGMTEGEAIYAADKAVRVSQGAGSPKDLAAIARGTGKHGELLKFFTMFYSYFSAYYQRQRTLWRDVRAASARDLPRLAARAWWMVVVPPLLVEVIKGAAMGTGGPDDDEAWAGWVFKKLLANALGPIPFARDLFEPMWDGAAGNKSFGYSLSPVQRVGETFVNVAKDTRKLSEGEETKRATRNALEAAGYATGLVPGQLASAAQFLVDVGYGDADPQTLGDWIEGLSTGRIKD